MQTKRELKQEDMAKITVQNTEITVISKNEEDYISLTDMARSQMQEHIIFRWLSLKSTIEHLGEWEMLYNPIFNCTESVQLKIWLAATTLYFRKELDRKNWCYRDYI